MLMTAATVVQQLCKSCRTCFKFYCVFYFTCDRSFRATRQLCWWAQLFCFAAVVSFFLSFFFSPSNLRGRSVDRRQIFTHVRRWPEFIKLGQKFGAPLPKKVWRPQNIKIWGTFRKPSQLVLFYDFGKCGPILVIISLSPCEWRDSLFPSRLAGLVVPWSAGDVWRLVDCSVFCHWYSSVRWYTNRSIN